METDRILAAIDRHISLLQQARALLVDAETVTPGKRRGRPKGSGKKIAIDAVAGAVKGLPRKSSDNERALPNAAVKPARPAKKSGAKSTKRAAKKSATALVPAKNLAKGSRLAEKTKARKKIAAAKKSAATSAGTGEAAEGQSGSTDS